MYLTFAEFQTLCPDSSITEQQYNALENRAESDIDTLTFNRITAIGFDNLTAFQQDKVRLALSQQTAFVLTMPSCLTVRSAPIVSAVCQCPLTARRL